MQFVKRTGLAVVLALALGVSLGATAASASYFTAGSYPATFKGYSPYDQQYTQSGGRTIRCSGAYLTAEATLLGRSDSLSPTFNGGECKETGIGLETGIKLAMNGCGYTFHAESEIETGVYEGTADLGPFGCGPMTLNGSRCERKFAAQWGVPVTIRNVGTGKEAGITVEFTHGSLLYTTVGNASICGSGVQSMGITASWELSAYAAGAEQVPASVSEPPAVKLFVAGEESTEEAKQPRFEAESYPVTVNAKQKINEAYTLGLEGGRKLSCEKANLQGSLSGPASKLGLKPDLRSCTATILGNPYPAVVVPNSCNFGLSALKVAAPSYTASLDVTCSKEGDAIEVLAYVSAQKQAEGVPLCTYRIGAQSGVTGVGLHNTIFFGTTHGIAISFSTGGITTARSQGTATNCGGKTQSGILTGNGRMIAQ